MNLRKALHSLLYNRAWLSILKAWEFYFYEFLVLKRRKTSTTTIFISCIYAGCHLSITSLNFFHITTISFIYLEILSVNLQFDSLIAYLCCISNVGYRISWSVSRLSDSVKLNYNMKSPRNIYILFGNPKYLQKMASKMAQASVFFQKQNWDRSGVA